jgi:hypothetical protein
VTLTYPLDPVLEYARARRLGAVPINSAEQHHNAACHHETSDVKIADCLGKTPGWVYWHAVRGLTVAEADEVALALGYDPAHFWPSFYDDALDGPLCLWCGWPMPDALVPTTCETACADALAAERKEVAALSRRFWARVRRYSQHPLPIEEAA